MKTVSIKDLLQWNEKTFFLFLVPGGLGYCTDPTKWKMAVKRCTVTSSASALEDLKGSLSIGLSGLNRWSIHRNCIFPLHLSLETRERTGRSPRTSCLFASAVISPVTFLPLCLQQLQRAERRQMYL